MSIQNIVSISGGKDSTATLLLAIALDTPNLSAVFADTGNERPETYDYVRYLQDSVGIEIKWVKADFSSQIEKKRKYVQEKWPLKGVPDNVVDRALSVLVPTGNPFLDLCLWKGRFPSRMSQFCTHELKITPIFEQVFFPFLDSGEIIHSWQGVRRDESLARRYLPEFEDVGGGLFNYRPILKWPAAATFEAASYMGIKHNPLYTQGCSRVGCFCINQSKKELLNHSKRWQEDIDRIEEWEKLVAMANKIGFSTFFASPSDDAPENIFKNGNIRKAVEWSRTTRGGKQFDLLGGMNDSKECASSYGLCEK